MLSAGPILIAGVALRDEFSCPITRELMRDPVIATDGHTYDREAIEMWLRNHDTSPKTGQPMDQLSLVPNLNLRRLIKDLLNEGGEGLYLQHLGSDDMDDTKQGRGSGEKPIGEKRDYCFALVAEQILVLKCLGPTDSDWNDKSFRVTERGCTGGRKQPALLEGVDFMQFSDATVSRRHFGIIFDKEDKQFSLKDFGSAGGTFVRLAKGMPTPLYPSMMIMLGKHQLEVTRAPSRAGDLNVEAEPESVADDKAKITDARIPGHGDHQPSAPLARGRSRRGAGAGVKEGAATDQEEGGGSRERGRPTNTFSDKSFKLDDALSALRIAERSDADGVGLVERDVARPALFVEGVSGEHRGRQDSSRSPLPHENASQHDNTSAEEDDASVPDTPVQRNHDDADDGGATDDDKELGNVDKSFEVGLKLARGHRTVCLECFAPEGTPIQGRRFTVGKEGATLGRKQTNTIAFSHESNGTVMGIDASISGDHARIIYDQGGDYLYIMDGTPTKPSTNGTWFRLSGMHKESRPYPLSNGTEILIGTVRFSVTLETMVVEKELTPENRDYYVSLATKSGARRFSLLRGAERDKRPEGRQHTRVGN